MYTKKRNISVIPFIFVRQSSNVTNNRPDRMDKLASLWGIIRRNKYWITLSVFTVIIVFLDENSILHRMEYYRQAARLRSEIEKYREEYEENTERLEELAADSGAIEQVAREKYFMKKPNEDVYVFEEDFD